MAAMPEIIDQYETTMVPPPGVAPARASMDCTISLCAVVDASSEEAAWEVILSYWPEAQRRFCEQRGQSWLPLASGRFQCIIDKMNKVARTQ